METTLHQQLKLRYAASAEQTEVSVAGFRIDAIGSRGELVEIQHASLGALRSKVTQLLDSTNKHVRVVKPIVARKWLHMLDAPDGEVVRHRLSPKHCNELDIFLDLVHFSSVFPRQRLTLEVVLLEIEERRVPRKRSSRRGRNYTSIDQSILNVVSSVELRTNRDLWELIPGGVVSGAFDTAQLARVLDRPRWFAQKVAYCLRMTGAAKSVGKRGNNQLYKAGIRTSVRTAA